MLRKYTQTTCKGQWFTEALQATLAAVKSGMHLCEPAKEFEISFTTLHQHHKGKHHVSNQIIILKIWSAMQVQLYLHFGAMVAEVGVPGKDWWNLFLRRQPQHCERKPEHLSKKRALDVMQKVVDQWIELVQKLLNKNGLDEVS